jgi:release factor glutamine methyltransferase
VSIAKLAPSTNVFTADSNIDTLRVAQSNADYNGVSDRVTLKHGDIFDAFKGENLEGKVDVIVSNPPYIPDTEKGLLAPEVLFEPLGALFGGDDGLDFYKAIMLDAAKFLKAGGVVAFEMNAGKSAEIQKIIIDAGFIIDKVVKDYAGLERVVIASHNCKMKI